MRSLRPALLAALALGLAPLACSKDDEAPPLPPQALAEGCQPLLGGADCFMPYPSDFYRVADPTLPSGFRIDVTGAAKLTGAHGINADVDDLRPIDGASHIPTLVTFFPEPTAAEGFVGLLDDPDGSTQLSSEVLLIEAESGALVPTYTDLDPRATDPARQAIVIHPLVGLKARTRYVVALHGVHGTDGALLPTPEGFRRIREGVAQGDPVLQPLAERYATDVLPVLTKAGLALSEVQQAWDFTVGSDEYPRADMLQIRALTLAWLQDHVPAVTITNVQTLNDPSVWQEITGTVEGPLFMNAAAPGSALHRDDQGAITQNGTAAFTFTAEVPLSVRDQFDPGMPLAYGHGFFGGQNELGGGSARNLTNVLHAVLFGIDWVGMSTPDSLVLAAAISSKPAKTMGFADRVHQAMANWMVMSAAIKGPLRTQSAFLRPTSGDGVQTVNGVSNAGAPLYAEGAPSYIGISQGQILGGTMTALDPDFSRIVFECGGAGFTHMMFRASPFTDFMGFMADGIPDAMDQQKFTASLQPQFDRFDPGTYADLLLRSPLPGSPVDRRVLMQAGLGDSTVPNLGTFLHARLLGLPVLTPSPTVPFGLGKVAAPTTQSAFTLWDYGIDLAAEYAVPNLDAPDAHVHENLRRQPSALAQMAHFYATGEIINPCDGGACHATTD